MPDQDAGAIHLSYHDGEHYNSVRAASDFSPGPPQTIVLSARRATDAERSAGVAAARAWGRAEEDAVALGTGCFDDREAVQSALEDAHGSVDQVRGAPGVLAMCCMQHQNTLLGIQGRAWPCRQ